MSYPGAPSFQIQACEAAYAITPSDTVAGPVMWKYLYVGGAGNVTMLDASNNVVTFVGVPAGTQLLIAGKRVNATGTTATNIVGMV